MATYLDSLNGKHSDGSEQEPKEPAYEFKIPVEWAMYGLQVVKADSLEEAIRMTKEDDLPLPEGDYLDGSFQVTDNPDDPVTQELNKEVLEVIRVNETERKKLPLLIESLESKGAKTRLEERLKEE